MARGAAAKGRRVAFGDGRRIMWDPNSAVIFRGNPNIAPPGSERGNAKIKWINFRKGHRIYNTHDVAGNRWVWNMEFRPIPGEMFFDKHEVEWAERQGSGFILVEPNVPAWKTCAPNKQWPVERYDEVVRLLRHAGYDVVQPTYGERVRHLCPGVRAIPTPSFRYALALLARASLYIGAEGGMHHGAAAVGVPGVVLFGGFIPPEVTGYQTHTNLTGGVEACGSLAPCDHCRIAMQSIEVDEVIAAAEDRLRLAA